MACSSHYLRPLHLEETSENTIYIGDNDFMCDDDWLLIDWFTNTQIKPTDELISLGVTMQNLESFLNQWDNLPLEESRRLRKLVQFQAVGRLITQEFVDELKAKKDEWVVYFGHSYDKALEVFSNNIGHYFISDETYSYSDLFNT